MGGLAAGWKVVIVMIRVGFILFLVSAAWQDLRKRCIKTGTLMIFGGGGIVLRCMQMVLEGSMMYGLADRSGLRGLLWGHLRDLGLAMAVGGGLLLLSAVAGEAIGDGDGWFFVVTGLYLGAVRNMLLLAGGLGGCFLMCIALVLCAIIRGTSVRRMRLPFLPFLVLPGIGVMFL